MAELVATICVGFEGMCLCGEGREGPQSKGKGKDQGKGKAGKGEEWMLRPAGKGKEWIPKGPGKGKDECKGNEGKGLKWYVNKKGVARKRRPKNANGVERQRKLLAIKRQVARLRWMYHLLAMRAERARARIITRSASWP